MSEPMEVEYGGVWYQCLYVSPADKDGDIAVVYENEGEHMTCHVFSDEKNRLRPAPKPEAKVSADGWEVVESSEGANGIFCRRYSQSSCYVWEYLMPNLGVIRGYPHGASFGNSIAALAALATWRAKNEAFVPTLHEPVEGVTLWSYPENADFERGPVVRVDGVDAYGHFSREMVPTRAVIPTLAGESWPAFRDRVRSERSERAAKSNPSPLTPEQEAAVREIVKDVMAAPTF